MELRPTVRRFSAASFRLSASQIAYSLLNAIRRQNDLPQGLVESIATYDFPRSCLSVNYTFCQFSLGRSGGTIRPLPHPPTRRPDMVMNEMTEKECREALARTSFGRLGCSLGDQPYIVPVCLASDGDFIYVFSTLGKKIVWMRANPKVCIQIDEINGQSQWSSVFVNGRYEELPEPQHTGERKHARQLLEKRSVVAEHIC